jgi:hypothetical protein
VASFIKLVNLHDKNSFLSWLNDLMECVKCCVARHLAGGGVLVAFTNEEAGASFTKLTCVSDVTFGNFLI